jgi:hypothetical protein
MPVRKFITATMTRWTYTLAAGYAGVHVIGHHTEYSENGYFYPVPESEIFDEVKSALSARQRRKLDLLEENGVAYDIAMVVMDQPHINEPVYSETSVLLCLDLAAETLLRVGLPDAG